VVKNPPANAGDMRPGFDTGVGKIPWRRAWQPTPVFLPRESHGQRSLGDTIHSFAQGWTGLKQLSRHLNIKRLLLIKEKLDISS